MVDESVGLGQGVTDLYIVLNDEQTGLIKQILERSALEYYDGVGDLVTMLECFEDDVARVWRLVEWHDALAEIDDATWKFLESDDPNDLELRFKESAWLYRLKKRIEIELKLRELRDGERENKPFENKDKKLLIGFSDYLVESIPSVDFLDKDNESRLELINNFLVEWWKQNE